jgi:hypothetical protein
METTSNLSTACFKNWKLHFYNRIYLCVLNDTQYTYVNSIIRLIFEMKIQWAFCEAESDLESGSETYSTQDGLSCQVVLWSLKQYSSIPQHFYPGIPTLWTQNESSELLGFWTLSIDWNPEYYKRRKGNAWKPSEPESSCQPIFHISEIRNLMYFATTSIFSYCHSFYLIHSCLKRFYMKWYWNNYGKARKKK